MGGAGVRDLAMADEGATANVDAAAAGATVVNAADVDAPTVDVTAGTDGAELPVINCSGGDFLGDVVACTAFVTASGSVPLFPCCHRIVFFRAGMDFDFFLDFGSFLDLDDGALGSDETALPLGFPFPRPFDFAPA